MCIEDRAMISNARIVYISGYTVVSLYLCYVIQEIDEIGGDTKDGSRKCKYCERED